MIYKILKANGRSCNGGDAQWSLPTKDEDGTWTAGDWMPKIRGKLIPCEKGYHLAKDEQVIQWLNKTIYEAEYEGEIIEETDKLVCRTARLLRKFEGWNEKNVRLFAADCGEHVLHLFENKYPDDKRPRQVIEASRKYANGEITEDDLAAAWDAAWDAAWAAAWAAAWPAARDAAWDAEREWQYKKLVEYLEAQ